MATPPNKIATDDEILEAISKFETRQEAANFLGMARNTLSNRLVLLRQKQPEEPRPNTYSHDKSKSTKRYFISSVVSGAPLSKHYKAVKVMCEHLSAQEIYIPVQYDWKDIKSGKEDPTYPRTVKHLLLSKDIEINEHLNLMGSVPIHATIQNPLSGMFHTSKNKSAIYGHPQRAMKSVATAKSKLPKLLYTTGAITEPRYTASKAGRKSQDNHHMGGLIVEVKDERFHVFEVTINGKGEIYHLDYLYSKKGAKKHDGLSAIYMADEHAEGYDDDVKVATYTGDNAMVKQLNPEFVVRGDVYNHGSDSHHGRHNALHRIIRHNLGANSVKKELDDCFDHLRETTVSGYQNVIVASNHHEHLTRWLNEFNPHTGDPVNILLYHQLNAMMIEEALEGNTVDPFEMYGRRFHKDIYSQCVFVPMDGDFDIAGVDCSQHGAVGPNGARASAMNLSLLGKPTIIGHGHSPMIYRNVHQVGVGASELGYNRGPSGWMATHCFVYPDGSLSLAHIVFGEWRL